MPEADCPNMSTCKLVTDAGFIGDSMLRERYLTSYCRNEKLGYTFCNRYITKETIHFCPDFVLPDSAMTVDEIIERFEELDKQS